MITEHRRKQIREAARRYRERYPDRVVASKERHKRNSGARTRNYHRKYKIFERARYPLRSTWQHIKMRCLNPRCRSYKNYGGRGIGIFSEWVQSREAFEHYILSTIGPRPAGLTLDRIDNNRGYEPGNLRWATYSQQAKNRRGNGRRKQ